MDELNELESAFTRLLGQIPCDDQGRAEHRDALRLRALAAFDAAGRQNVAPVAWKRVFNHGRDIMRRPLPRFLVAAACLAIAAVWFLVPGQQSTAQAFNMFAKAIVDAQSATFQTKLRVAGQPNQESKGYFLAPGRMRCEGKETISIVDGPAGRALLLQPQQKMAKVASVRNLRSDPSKPQLDDIFEQMRDLLSESHDSKEAKFKPLGEKEIDGRRAVGFRYDSPTTSLTLWGDPATGLPVLVESVWIGTPRIEATMSHFVLNDHLDPALFDTTPPAGYKVQIVDVDLSKPTPSEMELQATLKLKNIALALHNAMETRRRFPAAAICDANDKPLLSWRVGLLPFLNADGLYKQFHLDEPWDSEHNKPLVEKMPDVYLSPRVGDLAGRTVFLVPTGGETIFFGTKGTSPKQITDGLGETILLVEVDAEHAAPWTKPEDLVIDKEKPAAGLQIDDGHFLVARAGGTVTRLPADIDKATLWSFFTRAGGEKTNWPTDAVVKPTHAAAKPTEAALVEGLRMAADLNDGEFIDHPGIAGTQGLMLKHLTPSMKDNPLGIPPELLKRFSALGEGMKFAMELPESAEAHYAGKGVKRGEPDRPIFWYKPEGSKTYRVIFADLSVKEADSAPEVAGAVRLEKVKPAQQPEK